MHVTPTIHGKEHQKAAQNLMLVCTSGGIVFVVDANQQAVFIQLRTEVPQAPNPKPKT